MLFGWEWHVVIMGGGKIKQNFGQKPPKEETSAEIQG
jgi:hypothetical protein